MEVRRISNNSYYNAHPNFSGLTIKSTQVWNKDLLNSFTKNCEIESIIKKFDDIGINISARKGEDNFEMTKDNIFLWDETNHHFLTNILIGKDKKSFLYGAVCTHIKGTEGIRKLKAADVLSDLSEKFNYNFEHPTSRVKIDKFFKKIFNKENEKVIYA